MTKLSEVTIWEMDSWSGRDVLRVDEYKCLTKAEKAVAKHNSQNTSKVVPEYYTYAELTKKGDRLT